MGVMLPYCRTENATIRHLDLKSSSPLSAKYLSAEYRTGQLPH